MQTVGAGRYELEAEIAKGAIGTVWRARDTRTGARVAVKLLRPEAIGQPEVVDAFLAEAGILADLNHPCIVRARELVQAGGQYALIMDLVNGLDLRRRLRADGPLPPAVAVDVVAQIADALAYLHARGIVHGDVKPGNILVPVDGSPVRLTDFGVARRISKAGESRATHATPEYVSPEVIGGTPPRQSTDVYALGIVLYELLCGRSPFRGGGATEVLYRHVSCVPMAPPGFPEPVWPVVTDCLAQNPAGRPVSGTVAERLRALLPALDGHAPLPAIGPDVVTWWPRETQDTAPVPESRRRATWTGSAAAPVSPAVGYTRHSSDLPIGILPGAAAAEGPTAVARVPVPPAPQVTPAAAVATATATATAMATATAPVIATVVGRPGPVPDRSGTRRRWPSSMRLRLAGAGALLALVVGLGVVLMLNAGGGRTEQPNRPVAVLSPQPSGSGAASSPSAPAKSAPATPSRTPATDDGTGSANGTGTTGNGTGSGDGTGTTGTGSGNGTGTTGTGSANGGSGGQVPGMPSVPGMGSPMPTFPRG